MRNMFKSLRTFTVALCAVFLFAGFGAPVHAGDFGPVGAVKLMGGGFIDTSPGATTNDSVSFKFESKAVRLCLAPDSATMYVRAASQTSLASASIDRMTAPVNTPTIFTDGQLAGFHSGPAFKISASGDGTDQHCVTIPIRTEGITAYSSGSASLDIQAVR